jgi:UDP-N-acetyl-D-mannosaminuronate dehydrogenase
MSNRSQITDHTLPPAGHAAGTKWNFHLYTPGLVGGHCIPVDPYYLVHKAEEIG